MEKVEMLVFGRRALVDADMVEKMTKKEQLVNETRTLQKYYDADRINHSYVISLLQKKCSQLIHLNRKIRQTVQFI